MKLNIQLFAYNTTTVEVESQSSTGSGGYRHKILLQYYFRIDETARTYKIYAKELFYHAVTDDNWTNGSPYNRLLIDGVQKAKTTNNLGSPSGSGTFELCPDFKGSSWQDMGTYNYNIEGKGSEHIIGVSCGYASSWAGIQRKTTEHRIKPPNISPANSTITSITDITLGNAPTIKWTPIKSDDKFKITYTSSNGEASYTTPSFIEPGSTSEYTYNSDTLAVADFASEFSGETDTFTVQLDTYNSDGTLLGSDTDTFTVTLPSSVVPSVTIGTLTEADATMISKNWGVFVQNKSKLSIPITATGIYDSTIQSIVTTINGLNFTGTPVATPTLVTSGTNTISTTVTDSRGRTATDTETYSVVAYANPNIEIAQVQRCLSDGTISDNGTYLSIDFKSTISAVDNHNTALHRIGYKKTTDANYTYVTLSSNYAVNIASQVSTFTISTDYEYDIIFESTDAFMTATINRLIDTGFDLLNFNASGKSMAIGKVSTAGANDELLEVGLDTEFTKNVKFSSDGYSTSSTAGYTTDQYGNFQHQQNQSYDNLQFKDYNGTTKMAFHWEDGDLDVSGDVSCSDLEVNSINILDEIFYKPGDVIELGATDAKALTVDGFISDSSRQLLMSIPVPKRLDNITTITVTSVNVEARGHEGYLNNVSGYNEYVGASGYTFYIDKSSENTIRLRMAKSTAYTKSGGGNASNNVPISLNGYFRFELS